jgi:uncharacterized membrane protein
MTAAEREPPLAPLGGLGNARLAGRSPRPGSPPAYRHPVNQALLDAAPFGARLADTVTGFMGSWRFIAIQTAIVAVWLAANVILLTRPFDPFPFILLNLAFSTQAAYAAPLILLAGNRASQRDRMTLEHAADEGDLGDAQNERLLTCTTEILTRTAALEARILGMEETILGALQVANPAAETASAKERSNKQDSLKGAA